MREVYISPDAPRYPRPDDKNEFPRWYRPSTRVLTAILLVSLGVGCFFALGMAPIAKEMLKEVLR